MIKGVIFDIDGVLLDSFEVNLKFFQNLMIMTGHRPPTRKEFPELFHMNMMDVIKVLVGDIVQEEIEKIWKIGKSRDVSYDHGLLSMPERAEEIIKKLSKNYKLGIVTGRTKENVYEFPKLAQLKKYFKVAISYQDTVKHKPDPEPLFLATKKLGITPETCVYVGDVENDMKAAKSAGMKFILYSKKKFDGADARTVSFTKLPEIILSL